MNDRIKELIKQATINGEEYLPGNDGHPTPTVYFDKEKFAELIVKECIRICKDTEYYDDTALTPEHCGHIRAGAIFCREDIKQHFGIKE